MLFWFILSWKYYTCNIKGFCLSKQEETMPESIKKMDPIMFLGSSDSAHLFNFEAYRDSITLLAKDKNVDIVGNYFSSETNHTSFENLGLARANVLKQLLSKTIDSNKLFVSSKLMDGDSVSQDLFTATTVSLSNPVVLNSDKAQLVSRNGVLEVYFPVKSNKNIKDASFDSTLNVYMKSAIADNKKILIQGHTDNTGIEDVNVTLSKERAETIKNKVVSMGVKAENVTVEGKGSSMPKADNATPENRALNRRVEIKF